jgi:hypothetical protein
MLLWGETAQGHIRAVVIVGPHPTRGKVLNLFNAGPVILGYPNGHFLQTANAAQGADRYVKLSYVGEGLFFFFCANLSVRSDLVGASALGTQESVTAGRCPATQLFKYQINYQIPVVRGRITGAYIDGAVANY